MTSVLLSNRIRITRNSSDPSASAGAIHVKGNNLRLNHGSSWITQGGSSTLDLQYNAVGSVTYAYGAYSRGALYTLSGYSGTWRCVSVRQLGYGTTITPALFVRIS
jgi:hypothetical protein